jgi:hypothetical protein
MTGVEANREPQLKLRFIADLTTRSLADIAAQDYVQEALAPIRRHADRFVALLRGRAGIDDGVVTFDLTDQPPRPVSKFASYYLYPNAHYVVGLTLLPGKVKISVGSNPWQASRRTANIASICSRHGGGGHAAVGAISLPASDIERTRAIAADIARELRAAARQEK